MSKDQPVVTGVSQDEFDALVRDAMRWRARGGDLRAALDSAVDFIEEWANWWAYALGKPDGAKPTEADNAKAYELGDRAREAVIAGRRLLSKVPTP
jgi:hypothetical protein